VKTLSGSGRVSRVRSGYGSGNPVKAFFLDRAGRLGRVRLSYGSGNQVKTFFLSGGDLVSRVRSGKARGKQKPYLRLVLVLSLNPGWVSWVNWFWSARSG
jgi:hypothetical protein